MTHAPWVILTGAAGFLGSLLTGRWISQGHQVILLKRQSFSLRRFLPRLGPRLLLCAGKENTCGKRFGWQMGSLPRGYDHKYTCSHLGFNLKISDMQAAVGLAQIDRLPDFMQSRKRNFQYLKDRLSSLEEFLILPEATPNSEPS